MSSTGGGFAPMMTAGGSARYDPAEALEVDIIVKFWPFIVCI